MNNSKKSKQYENEVSEFLYLIHKKLKVSNPRKPNLGEYLKKALIERYELINPFNDFLSFAHGDKETKEANKRWYCRLKYVEYIREFPKRDKIKFRRLKDLNLTKYLEGVINEKFESEDKFKNWINTEDYKTQVFFHDNNKFVLYRRNDGYTLSFPSLNKNENK